MYDYDNRNIVMNWNIKRVNKLKFYRFFSTLLWVISKNYNT